MTCGFPLCRLDDVGRRWESLKFWVTDTLASRGRAARVPDDGLGKSVRDASGRGGLGVSAGRVINAAEESRDRYKKSFSDDCR